MPCWHRRLTRAGFCNRERNFRRYIHCPSRCRKVLPEGMHRMQSTNLLDETVLRQAIVAYFGLCSYLDHNIGRILQVLEATGLAATTRIIYTSGMQKASEIVASGVSSPCMENPPGSP